MDQSTPPTHQVDVVRSQIAQISRGVVRIHAEYYGRGPTRANTVWRDDVVVTVLYEIFTASEHTLVNAGHFDQVRQNRQAFQDQVEPILCQAVEEVTGRSVEAFLSQVSPQGIASEVFVLVPEPQGEDDSADQALPGPRRFGD